MAKNNRIWAILIGIGLALSPIHNRWLTELVTNDGEVGFFLPAFGTAIWLMGALAYLVYRWQKPDFGDKRIWIPLAVIVVAIALSGVTANGFTNKIAPFFMGLSLFGLYLVGRQLGKEIFLPLAAGTAIASLGVLIYAGLYPGKVTGGFVFENNYDVLAGYVLLGMALFFHRYQWLMAMLALAAILLSGSPEGLFVVAILSVAFLIRRDWNKRAVAVASLGVVLIGLFFTFGLYAYAVDISQNENFVLDPSKPQQVTTLEYRWRLIEDAMSNIKPLGEGYNIAAFSRNIVHNVPLIIVQQLGWPGIVAAAAWLWVTFYCIIKTKWKYAWLLIIGLSVFDHFIWTQLGPWWWAIAGASTASTIKTDLVFTNE